MDKTKKYQKLDFKKKIVLIAGIVGIALILFSSFFLSAQKPEQTGQKETFDTDSYRIELESRLADIISHIDGAGTTGVMITLDTGMEYTYAQNSEYSESSDSDSREISRSGEYYTVKSSQSIEQPILIRESQPKVRGVIVVCEGAGNESVKEAIINAVSSIFDISKSKISVNKIAK